MNQVRLFFGASAIYDLLLGLAFLIAPAYFFNLFNIAPPNHWGYVSFAGAMLAIFGIMFFQIAKDPKVNQNLIPYGILLKIAYCGTVFGYHFLDSIPKIWVVFGYCDLIFLALFIYSLILVKKA